MTQSVAGPGLEEDSLDDSPASGYFITLFRRKLTSTVH